MFNFRPSAALWAVLILVLVATGASTSHADDENDGLGMPPVPLPPVQGGWVDEPPAPPAPNPPADPAAPVPAAPDETDDGGSLSEDVREVVDAPSSGGARFERPRCCPPTWDLTVEGGISLFEDPEGLLGETLPAGSTPYNWGTNSYDPAFAARATVGRWIRRRDRAEVRFAYLGSADANSTQSAIFGFRPTPGAPVVISPTSTARLANETDLWSVEVNWWHTCCTPCGRFDLGVGGRYIRLDDEASATNWVGLAPISTLSGEAENGFLAAQIMAAYRWSPMPKLELAVSGKALVGWMQRDMTETDAAIVTGGFTMDAVREESGIGFGAEVELAAIYRVLPRVGITGAYNLLFLSDVSRAHEVFDLSQAATGSVQLFDRSSSAVIHSVFVGIRIDI